MIVGGGVFSFSHYPWLAEVNRISDAMLHGINPKLTEDGTGATYRNPGVCLDVGTRLVLSGRGWLPGCVGKGG